MNEDAEADPDADGTGEPSETDATDAADGADSPATGGSPASDDRAGAPGTDDGQPDPGPDDRPAEADRRATSGPTEGPEDRAPDPADREPETADQETETAGRDPDPAETGGSAPGGADDESETETAPDDAATTPQGESGKQPPDVDDDARPTVDDSDESPADDSSGPAPDVPDAEAGDAHATTDVPEDVRKYARFKKMDGAQYERVNEFLRDRTYITAREWAIARLCSDFRTETGVEMTKIGEHLPELVPFMTDTYTPQAVNQARSAFDEKVRKAGATFLYGAMCDFYTAEELDDVMYEVTEVAKFLLEVEGVDLSVEEELEAEDRISSVMREVRAASQELRADEAVTTKESTDDPGDTDGDGSEDGAEGPDDGDESEDVDRVDSEDESAGADAVGESTDEANGTTDSEEESTDDSAATETAETPAGRSTGDGTD